MFLLYLWQIMLYCTIEMIDSLSEVFGCIKLHKKGSRDISFYLRKLSLLGGKFCSTALVQSNIWHKVSITNAVLQNTHLNRDSFLN